MVNRVTAGDYECPRKVLTFLTDLHAAFRMLNLRNDFLRKKFDSKLFVQMVYSFILLEFAFACEFFLSSVALQKFMVFDFNPFTLVTGMKYDLRRVEEVYYDVKIRGLAATEDSVEQ